ncbi:hypothetical protein WS86_24465 [Burkholderia savannae]|uniref:hypothetical protein n=1 Tax=Burkholderia savannae TaxID=1637837 RepID=UPI000757AD22|nr:hypothetical protein [Burkholderia savannae]AOJ83785.1 hypothetical protein WS86_24465 [Burkholderia savannae]
MNFLQRLLEPSTHAGIGVLTTAASTVAVNLGADPSMVASVAAGVQGLFGLLAVFMSEKSA